MSSPPAINPATSGVKESNLRNGFDLVEIRQITESIVRFGSRFTDRLFTADEIGYAHVSDGQRDERLACRFAAKEATIKALQLGDKGIGWREIEVRKLADGDCAIALHGRVAAIAEAKGLEQIVLSMSHDGGYAGAFVTVVCREGR